MKIKSFTADKVYGHLDFNIDFYDDVTFLIGLNGCGKSTALRLMNALLSLSQGTLNKIDFNWLKLELEDGTEIKAVRNKEYITISGILDNESVKCPVFNEEELDAFERRHERYARLQKPHQSFKPTKLDKARDRLADCIRSVFLGLDRVIDRTNNEERTARRRPTRPYYYDDEPSNRSFEDTLLPSLHEANELFKKEFDEYQEKLKQEDESARNEMLKHLFSYIELQGHKREEYSWDGEKLTTILEGVARDLECIVNDKLVRDSLKRYFDDIGTAENDRGRLVEKLKEKRKKADTSEVEKIQREMDLKDQELLLNVLQMKKLEKVNEVLSTRKNNVEDARNKLDTFLKTVNAFLKDTKKEITEDSLGNLHIAAREGKGGIEQSSSGERQLIIMFANLILDTQGRTTDVFVIDEPELSLHLEWQRIFVKQIRRACPDTQVIVATHSPPVYADRLERAISLDKTC